ncbi:hypothetical protein [Actinomadura atramentaria]|uniref:hypothetical protein n=1 Tax=Actinomadura atramentaria TaxID=1990 RepID=UPI0003AB0A46|nr:hypothetical protein [Actinomadura atramentaria]
MSDATAVRHGYYAGWGGADYEASPDGPRARLYSPRPAAGFTAARDGRYVRVVPVTELEHLSYVSTRCVWRGEPFLVLAHHDGWLRVEYTGGKAPVAERLGLEPFDRGVYQAWAPLRDVTELREEWV